MRLDALLVSAALLAGAGESFVPRSAAPSAVYRPASSVTHHDTGTALPRTRGRKRPRAYSARMDADARAAAAASEGQDPPPPYPAGLPPRLQAAVDMLGRDADLKTKSKLLVELGDAFAKTDAAVLPKPPPPGDDDVSSNSSSVLADGWSSQKVPGCVSEVHVAVRVDKSPSPRAGAALGGDDSLGGGGGGGVVSIRGTADARLSRGLLALLALGLQGQSPRTVLSLRSKSLAAAVGMRAGLTDSRINGLGNVLRVIQDQVRGHFRRAATAAADAADESSKAGPPPALVDLAGLQECIPQASSTSAGSPVAVPPPPVAPSQPPPRQEAAAAGPPPRATPASPAAMVAADLSSSAAAGLDPSRSWGDDASSWYPLPGSENEVAMLLSGGVDSSVAMRLLQDQGYKIRAFYLKIWLEDELAHLNECPWVSGGTRAVCPHYWFSPACSWVFLAAPRAGR